MTIKNKKSPLKYAAMKDAPEEIILKHRYKT